MSGVVARCSCGCCFTAAGFAALRQLGRQEAEEGVELRLANCLCGSTISREVKS